MLRVKVFAAAMDMMAAGTSAPMATAANATPVNHDGNASSNSWGMTSWALGLPSSPIGLVPAAMATQPSSASSASTKEYAGRIAALRRIVLRFLEDSTAVTECGYMNSAIAEPRPKVANAQYCLAPGMNTPLGFLVTAFVAAILACAASKMWLHPPNLWGR